MNESGAAALDRCTGELAPDRAENPAGVSPRMRAHRFDARVAEDRVVVVPTEHLVGEQVEVLVNPEAALPEELVERHAVGTVRLPREQMVLHRRCEPA